MKHSSVLLLPDWQHSERDGWMTWWEQRHGYTRVQQHDIRHPLRGDWIMRLEESLIALDEPVTLAARGLGCHLVAAWASHSSNIHRVSGALLVTPNDPAAPEFAGFLHSWTRMPARALPFPSVVVSGSPDPDTAACAFGLAAVWGSHIVDCEEEPGEWPTGHRQLQGLAAQRPHNLPRQF